MRYALLWAIAGVFLEACGGGGGAKPDGAVVEAGPEAMDLEIASTPYCTDKFPAAGVPDVSGLWVARVVGAQIVYPPLGLPEIRNKNIFYLLLSISQNGTAIAVNGRYCDRAQIGQPGALLSIVIPDAWAHTETAVRRAGSFVPGSAGYPVLSLPTVTEIIGAVLDVPSDALPTKPGDRGVIDEDNDGQPGITVRLSGLSTAGSLFAVQRQSTAIEAIAVAPGRLEGTLAFSSEQVILSSDTADLKGLFSQSVTAPDSVKCNSGVVMVRVGDLVAGDGGLIDPVAADAGTLAGGLGAFDCAWVRANALVLFP